MECGISIAFLCKNFVTLCFQDMPFPYVERKSDCASHHFLAPNFLAAAQIHYRDHTPVLYCSDTITMAGKPQCLEVAMASQLNVFLSYPKAKIEELKTRIEGLASTLQDQDAQEMGDYQEATEQNLEIKMSNT